MNTQQYDDLLNEICRKTGFVAKGVLYQGTYYKNKSIRNIVIEGTYKRRKAVLKIYDDPRVNFEPINQKAFYEINKSVVLKVLEVYRCEIISPNKGWFIMEKLPERGSFFGQPIENKKEFVRLFLLYRKYWPKEPTRELAPIERLPAHLYHLFKINRWVELMNNEEVRLALVGKQPLLISKSKKDDFTPRFEKAIALIEEEFKKRKMIWCHAHFKPHEIFKVSDEKYFLTDFAHCQMCPEGYELAFIIWADWIMSADWRMDYDEWKIGVKDWVKFLKPVARKLKIENFEELMRASLAERILGTILADVCASDRPREEKEGRIILLYALLDDVLDAEKFKESFL